eukprot:CAMPEP_0206635378 /NCGR_PEP_ID=MMETSP0325_2-20121206/70533_1 /ASSEMBLY_ACC=CAM_ASM_000347 /TAXON_ID=2866 /ORGANISM="Crypthecodinium cohnii, Strain Seligo" /LENGTH=193 /DNA_ID=CAMNT_0054161217 /DNA_START=223 /DNA_END=801 /DNA_ORIENTATION=+
MKDVFPQASESLIEGSESWLRTPWEASDISRSALSLLAQLSSDAAKRGRSRLDNVVGKDFAGSECQEKGCLRRLPCGARSGAGAGAGECGSRHSRLCRGSGIVPCCTHGGGGRSEGEGGVRTSTGRDAAVGGGGGDLGVLYHRQFQSLLLLLLALTVGPSWPRALAERGAIKTRGVEAAAFQRRNHHAGSGDW